MTDRLTFNGPTPLPRDFYVHGEDKDFIVRTKGTHFVLRRESTSRIEDLVSLHDGECDVFLRWGREVLPVPLGMPSYALRHIIEKAMTGAAT